MDELWRYCGDLHDVLRPVAVYPILILTSALCGALLGWEREAKDKPAGMRTVALICVGSTVFTIASTLITGPDVDQSRVAAQIVTGIGFLGAGVIIRDQGEVRGLTTAAIIWTVAAIGLLIGTGRVVGGLSVTLLVLVLLKVLGRFDRDMDSRIIRK